MQERNEDVQLVDFGGENMEVAWLIDEFPGTWCICFCVTEMVGSYFERNVTISEIILLFSYDSRNNIATILTVQELH